MEDLFPKAVEINLSAIGAEALLQGHVEEILGTMQEQEEGTRQLGLIVLTLKVGFRLMERGVGVAVSSALKRPGLKAEGAVGMVSNGKLIVLEEHAKQAELPGVERIPRIIPRTNEEK